MSAEAPAVVVAPVSEPKPKNAHRLNRIFRKPKSTMAPRKWRVAHEDGEHAPRAAGVPASVIAKLVEGLTEEEKARAKAGQDPMTATQEALMKRAARFGLPIAAAVKAPAIPVATFVVDEETLRRREERFKTAPSS